MIFESWEERERKLRQRIDQEDKELAWSWFGCHAVGFISVLGIVYAIDSCQPNNSLKELQHQYKNCQYYLDRAANDESKKFVNDDIFVIEGKYKGKTCREIINDYELRKQ